MTKNMKFQMKLVEDLRKGERLNYKDASIYTILLDLVDGSSIEEIFSILSLIKDDLSIMKSIFKKGDTVYHFNYGKEKGLVDDIVESTGMVGVSFKGYYDYFTPNHLSFKPYDLVNGGLTHKRKVYEVHKVMKRLKPGLD